MAILFKFTHYFLFLCIALLLSIIISRIAKKKIQNQLTPLFFFALGMIVIAHFTYYDFTMCADFSSITFEAVRLLFKIIVLFALYWVMIKFVFRTSIGFEYAKSAKSYFILIAQLVVILLWSATIILFSNSPSILTILPDSYFPISGSIVIAVSWASSLFAMWIAASPKRKSKEFNTR